MAEKERRIMPRRNCQLALRYRIAAPHDAAAVSPAASEGIHLPSVPAPSPTLEGEALNLSERGIYFTAHEKPSIGAPLEIYLTLPREVTGREPEPVRCQARVIHVEEHTDQQGMRGIGAAVERFEPLMRASDWSN